METETAKSLLLPTELPQTETARDLLLHMVLQVGHPPPTAHQVSHLLLMVPHPDHLPLMVPQHQLLQAATAHLPLETADPTDIVQVEMVATAPAATVVATVLVDIAREEMVGDTALVEMAVDIALVETVADIALEETVADTAREAMEVTVREAMAVTAQEVMEMEGTVQEEEAEATAMGEVKVMPAMEDTHTKCTVRRQDKHCI